jgi:hypothetical protein
MTSQNTGADPVTVLYDRFTLDIFTLQDSLRCDRMVNPYSSNELEANAKECWALFESYLKTYRLVLERLNESLRLHRELLQDQELNKLVFRTRAKQGKQPYIIDAKAYVEKARLLYLRWIEELTPVDGKRTGKAFLDKVDHCQALWVEYGFAIEKIEELKTLVDKLQNEKALIEVDREPTYKANLPTPTQDDQPKVDTPKKLTKKAGRKPKPWTPLEIEVDELKSQGKTPYEIRDALRGKYPDLTRDQVNAIIESLRKRRGRGNGPK